MKRLDNKVAVVYGDGGVGAAIAKAFAQEGAKIFLTGRTAKKLQHIADEITASGGLVETAQLDALDEKAVDQHMNDIVSKAGSIDISFNAIGIPQKGIQGIPLSELSVESFTRPANVYLTSHFITARAAARRMVQQGQGVILIHTPNASRISWPFVGGMIPAWAALEALGRSLSVEFAEKGVRSVTLLTTGIPETTLIDEVFEIHGKTTGTSYEQFLTGMVSTTHTKKLTTLAQLSAAAVFAASDEGAAITGTILNLTAGMIVD